MLKIVLPFNSSLKYSALYMNNTRAGLTTLVSMGHYMQVVRHIGTVRAGLWTMKSAVFL